MRTAITEPGNRDLTPTSADARCVIRGPSEPSSPFPSTPTCQVFPHATEASQSTVCLQYEDDVFDHELAQTLCSCCCAPVGRRRAPDHARPGSHRAAAQGRVPTKLAAYPWRPNRDCGHLKWSSAPRPPAKSNLLARTLTWSRAPSGRRGSSSQRPRPPWRRSWLCQRRRNARARAG